MSNMAILKDDALKEMSDHAIFSIEFYTSKGELKCIDRARRCRLPAHFNSKQYIGVVDIQDDSKESHPYPVFIHLIESFNQIPLAW